MKDRMGLYTHRLYSKEDVANDKVKECCIQLSRELREDDKKLRDYIEMQPDPSEPMSKCYGCHGCPESQGL